MSDRQTANENTDDIQPGQDSAYDPRPVSDAQLREEVSREEVEGYRRKADQAHKNWFSVMNNPYGKD